MLICVFQWAKTAERISYKFSWSFYAECGWRKLTCYFYSCALLCRMQSLSRMVWGRTTLDDGKPH